MENFGMPYKDFLTNGKNWLPETRHALAVQAIETLSLGVDSLIVGYAASFPLIIETDQQCRAYIRDSFATVGEGGHLAHSSLMYREHDEVHTYSNALYAVYEAKNRHNVT